eukprot:CAMPEP_0202980064 /NCGR_PEP_ID=MMETSP1396-20130829/86057_1 /ASSEMBLY_ACC=CAM_ASM_000872 /TAXON_ID= /ORGANISM="Pseudokeronopsis sp., Strain Brazil" /LENGTH=96 /DNA_ID=CAMNT_0049719801 /DNA_START=739 /DNA_END=1029 /DNA_ORIENTATION=-
MGESTLGDEEQSPAVQKKPSEWIPREDFEEVLSKLRILTEENAVLKMREEAARVFSVNEIDKRGAISPVQTIEGSHLLEERLLKQDKELQYLKKQN